jgi:hypothetical protein
MVSVTQVHIDENSDLSVSTVTPKKKPGHVSDQILQVQLHSALPFTKSTLAL